MREKKFLLHFIMSIIGIGNWESKFKNLCFCENLLLKYFLFKFCINKVLTVVKFFLSTNENFY